MTVPPSADRPRVAVLSPHFDDVPLSLGQSLRDGILSTCDVHVEVAFGRTNWTQWVHPTRSRARWIGQLRRFEESRASRRFGYRWRAADWEEALLRWDDLDPDRLLDHHTNLSGDPLLVELTDWVRHQAEGGTSGVPPDLLLAPAGLGGHVDHRLLALAAAGARPQCAVPIGHYEDRPYASHLSPERHDAALAELMRRPTPVAVSGPVTGATHRIVQRCYRSQMDDFFRSAMLHDRRTGAVERVWFESTEVPRWMA